MKVKNPKAQYRGRRRMMSSRRDDSMEKLAQEMHVPYDPPEPQADDLADLVDVYDDIINLLAGSATAGTIILSNLQVFLR